MELKELEYLKKCNTETDLIKLIQEIDDKVIFNGYNFEQMLYLVNEIIRIDLLSIKYHHFTTFYKKITHKALFVV